MRISRKQFVFAILVIILLATLSAWTLARRQFTPTPGPVTTTVPTTTTTGAVSVEVIAGISVYDETTFWYNARADDAKSAIEQAIALLPDHLANAIRTVPTFIVDSATRCPSSAAACFSYDENFEPFVELIMNAGGSRLWTVVHEYGHVVGNQLTPWGTVREASYFHGVYVTAREDNPPTRYGATRVGEDYADSFALYALDPEQLETCCPARYAYFHDLFTNP